MYDQAPALADQVTYSVDSVDVSAAAQTVTVRIHVTDDTGVSMVSFRPDLSVPWMPRSTGAHLVSGDIRDGWWEGSLTFRQTSRPGTYIPIVQTYDRVGRSNSQTFWDFSLPVVDANPDQSLPQVTLQKPTQAGSYDVRDGSVSVPVQARITDVGTGVDPDSLRVDLWSPDPNGVRRVAYGGQLTLTSGDLSDGTWDGTIKLPQGVTGGVWTLQVVVADKASRGSDFAAEYWGPAMFGGPAMWSYRENHPFPDGLGSVAVVGSAADVDPPAVSGVTVAPGSVSTLSGPAQVTITAHITDSGGSGVMVAGTMLRTADFSSAFLFGGLTLTSGTDQDGVWTGTVDLPQGTPPGTYYVAVNAYDNANNGRQYISSSYPSGIFPKLDTDPTVTVTNDAG
ncbi:hypothetical protein [Nocardioides cynanchi]|uniref:DUF7743 domain-containing protein n=1 Tax=Nocardioides cynanchi TaxID=2558918 RepID=UPI00192E1F0D|nr:hypothetical protein [Nocardioides cynanchi]